MSEPEKTPETPEPPAPEGPEGPSHPFVAVLFIFFILGVVGYNGKDSWWGVIPHLLALGFLAWGAWEGLSRKTLEHILKQYPRETREHWRLNSLLCMVVFPGLCWIVFGVPSLYHWLMR